ncbi:MAG: hypothetical protein J5658_03760 [Prevotella sp.]|nr:hypothetical protein [Prevotella sp.]
MKRSEALKYRQKIEQAAMTQGDEQALESIDLFPKWMPFILIVKDRRYQFGGKLYQALQSHTSQEDWTPDKVPALFVKVSLEEWSEIPEVITAESAWMKGQKGTWKGKHYISLIDYNVWNPDQYPAGWEEI